MAGNIYIYSWMLPVPEVVSKRSCAAWFATTGVGAEPASIAESAASPSLPPVAPMPACCTCADSRQPAATDAEEPSQEPESRRCTASPATQFDN